MPDAVMLPVTVNVETLNVADVTSSVVAFPYTVPATLDHVVVDPENVVLEVNVFPPVHVFVEDRETPPPPVAHVGTVPGPFD